MFDFGLLFAGPSCLGAGGFIVGFAVGACIIDAVGRVSPFWSSDDLIVLETGVLVLSARDRVVMVVRLRFCWLICAFGGAVLPSGGRNSVLGALVCLLFVITSLDAERHFLPSTALSRRSDFTFLSFAALALCGRSPC